MRIDLSPLERRLGLVGIGLFGLAHVLIPNLLLRVARTGYGLVLDVEFTPRENAADHVQAIGYLSVLAAVFGWRSLGEGDERI
jgi:hypothetical protein